MGKKIARIVIVLAALVAIVISIYFIKKNREEKAAKAKAIQKEVDREKFSRSLEHFSILQEMALEAMRPIDTLSKEEFLKRMQKTALVNWAECINLMQEAEALDLDAALDSLRSDISLYSDNRRRQTELYIRANLENTKIYNDSLNKLENAIQVQTEAIEKETGQLGLKEGPL